MTNKISDIFGSLTFDYDIMREMLPSDAYKNIQSTVAKGEPLDPSLAGIIAHAMKEWAVNEGVTHFTHWFQPDRTGTAEKHDSFLTTASFKNGIKPIERFSGSQLTQAEPDASSFPSGGVRSTFEARGYTAWDPTSSAFIKEHPGGKTLCIPSVYLSYTGEALDKKTPLLRSNSSLNKVMKDLFAVIKNPISGLFTTVGPEQEFFLIPKDLYMKRPDLRLTGRTLLGKPSPLGQKLEDHYFGAMPDKVLEFFAQLEDRAYRLGIPIKTRHNEVAPSQFELAPIFEHSNVANDHNQLLMDLMKKIALDLDLVALLHEKPFAGVNGSGKHNNWSMMTFEGRNLLDPGSNKDEHLEFLLILSIIIRGIYKRSKLLRSVIAVPGNDFRLGANEAPPAIISVYVGETIKEILDEIESGKTVTTIKDKETIKDKKKGSIGYTLGLDQLPNIRRDNTDRNRTSPFAFTGNKFEFRAVGSSQVLGFVNTVLNAIIAESVVDATKLLKKKLKSKITKDGAIIEVIRKFYTESKPVVFNGNNYSDDWVEEALTRGLPNIKTGYEALLELPKNVKLFSSLNILTERELKARYNVRIEQYIHQIHIEALTLIDMVKTGVIPAIVNYYGDLANAASLFDKNELDDYCGRFKTLKQLVSELKTALNAENESSEEEAKHATFTIKPVMDEIRSFVDQFEQEVPKNIWPFPDYADLLHTF